MPQLKDGYKLVLASQSPRRRELLSTLNIPFEVVVPDASAEPDDAQPEAGESIPKFVERLAYQKASSVAKLVPYPALVIGCDTVADVDGQLLGKPKDRQDAQRMLRLLSGRIHSVWSGLCVIDSANGNVRSVIAESQLFMNQLSETELTEYLDSGAWQGKSGVWIPDGHPWLGHFRLGRERCWPTVQELGELASSALNVATFARRWIAHGSRPLHRTEPTAALRIFVLLAEDFVVGISRRHRVPRNDERNPQLAL
ncbi:MAG: nucleoside triphosphate pyrophosphatase [Pirellulales bacterium]